MQLNPGSSSTVDILYSTNGEFRGRDKSVDDAFPYWGSHESTSTGSDLPAVKLFNPSGSPHDILVDKLTMVCITSNAIFISREQNVSGTAGGFSRSKKINTALNEAELYTEETTANIGTRICNSSIYSGTLNFMEFEYPVLLPPNNALVIQLRSVADFLRVMFEWREINSP